MLRVIDTENLRLQGASLKSPRSIIVDGQITNPMSHLVRPDRPIQPAGDGYPGSRKRWSLISRGLRRLFHT